MIFIIRAKDDGDFDSPTSRDETPDFIKNKRGQRSPNKKRGQRIPPKNERKREKGQCYYPFSTLVLQNSTVFFIDRESLILSLSCTSGFFTL